MSCKSEDPSLDNLHQRSKNIVDIKDKVWNGKINVLIILLLPTTTTDVSKEVKIEFLISIYRNSYFPIHLPSIISFFSHYKPDLDTCQVWFEYEGVPIKWHLPVGLLYDYLHLPSIVDDRSNKSNELVLNLKFGNKADYPRDYIIPFIYNNSDQSINYLKSLKEVIVNQLKQSCFVMNGNSKNVMNLSEKNSNDLWSSIENHNFKVFQNLNKKIISNSNNLSKIPVRIYIPGFTAIIQAPIFPYKLDKEPTTLNDILIDNLPDFFGDVMIRQAYIHGIKVDQLYDQPIIEIWNIFKHLDNFLYIIII